MAPRAPAALLTSVGTRRGHYFWPSIFHRCFAEATAVELFLQHYPMEEIPMIQKISVVVLALFMSAASAYAVAPMQSHHMPPIKRHHMTHRGMMMPMCAEGQTKAKCVCGSKAGSAGAQVCGAGQWCHAFTGACTM